MDERKKKKRYLQPKVIHLPTNVKKLVQTTSNCGGSCPYVFVKDNRKNYIVENNLLPYSENLLRKDKVLTDYYILQTTPGIEEDYLNIKVKEIDKEVSWFEKFSLMTIEHPVGYKVGISNAEEFLTYNNPTLPYWCFDKNGNNCMDLISNTDWKNPEKFFQARAGDFLEMDFGKINTNNAKLVIVDPKDEEDEQIILAKCSIISIHISVYTENWQEINIIQTRDRFYPDIVDLTGYLDKVKNNFKMKLEFTASHKVAFIGIDTSSPVPMKKKGYRLQMATHSSLGDVTEDLKHKNGQFVRVASGEEIDLKFPMPEAAKKSNELSYVLVTQGYYIPVKRLLSMNKQQEVSSFNLIEKIRLNN